MLLTPHTTVGLAIATVIPNPIISVPLSFFMHFMGDLVPHWDFYSHTTKEERVRGWRPIAVMADLVAGVAIGLTVTLYTLWVKHNSMLALNMFLCGIASVLPDALETPNLYLKHEPKLLQLISRTQAKLQFQAKLPWGIISQFVVMGLMGWIILHSLR